MPPTYRAPRYGGAYASLKPHPRLRRAKRSPASLLILCLGRSPLFYFTPRCIAKILRVTHFFASEERKRYPYGAGPTDEIYGIWGWSANGSIEPFKFYSIEKVPRPAVRLASNNADAGGARWRSSVTGALAVVGRRRSSAGGRSMRPAVDSASSVCRSSLPVVACYRLLSCRDVRAGTLRALRARAVLRVASYGGRVVADCAGAGAGGMCGDRQKREKKRTRAGRVQSWRSFGYASRPVCASSP